MTERISQDHHSTQKKKKLLRVCVLLAKNLVVILLEQLSQTSLSVTMGMWSNMDLNLIPDKLERPQSGIWGKRKSTKTC